MLWNPDVKDGIRAQSQGGSTFILWMTSFCILYFAAFSLFCCKSILCYRKAFCANLLRLYSLWADSCLLWRLLCVSQNCYGWTDSWDSTGFPKRYQSCSCRERSSFLSVGPGLSSPADWLVYLTHANRNLLRAYHLAEQNNFSRTAKITSTSSSQHSWQSSASQ